VTPAETAFRTAYTLMGARKPQSTHGGAFVATRVGQFKVADSELEAMAWVASVDPDLTVIADALAKLLDERPDIAAAIRRHRWK